MWKKEKKISFFYDISSVWEIRKHKLCDSDSGPGQQLDSRSSPGERNGKFGQNG